MTAIVSAASGNAVPTGEVHFSNGMLGVLDSNGIATVTVSVSSSAPVQLGMNATYAGSNGFKSSTSNTIEVSVLPAVVKTTTATALTASASSITIADTVTLTANVTGTGAGIPTGSVILSNGSSAILDATGTATFTLPASSLSIGNNSITATYGGSVSSSASTSAPVMVAVLKPDFSIVGPATLTVVQGQASTASFTVTPINGFSGSVLVECNGNSLDCSLSQASVDVSHGVGNTSATVSETTAATAALFGLISLLGLSRRKRLVAVAAFTVLWMVLIGGCGSASAPVTPVAAVPTSTQTTLYVRASANGITHTVSIAVTKQ